MIRVNLLRDSTSKNAGATEIGSVDGVTEIHDGASSGPSRNAELLIRVFLVILPVMGLYGFRMYSDRVARSEISSLKGELDSTNKKLKGLDPIVKEVERFQEEKRKLESQLEIIKALSKERLKCVKSLDSLQSIIPSKAWLTNLKLNENRVELEGLATDDLVVSEFMNALEASVYFANVQLTSSEEQKKDEGVVKKFGLRCNLENL